MSIFNSDTNAKLTQKLPEKRITTIGALTSKEKKILQKNYVQYYVKASFMITYILLLTTATITFIEAMRTKVDSIRHVLNLETCVSLVACYFYSIFVTQIEDYNKTGEKINWSDITKTRYVDWSITTPIMILILCIVTGSNIGVKISLRALALLIFLDILMLAFGYMGEINILNKNIAAMLGFIPFSILFYLIYIWFIAPKHVLINIAIFMIYLVLWGLYGLVYLFPEIYKNIAMNIFDCFAKCFVGIGLWLYYSKIVTV